MTRIFFSLVSHSFHNFGPEIEYLVADRENSLMQKLSFATFGRIFMNKFLETFGVFQLLNLHMKSRN